jgi:large subunit ribosomal protein L11
MAKKISGYISLHINPAQAKPGPPVGPALGQKGVNIMEFCKAFNAQTQGMSPELRLPVRIVVYADKTFSFKVLKPTVSSLLKQAAGIKKGATAPGRDKSIGSVTRSQLYQIAEEKKVDMNAYDLDSAVRIIEGSARAMGLVVTES